METIKRANLPKKEISKKNETTHTFSQKILKGGNPDMTNHKNLIAESCSNPLKIK